MTKQLHLYLTTLLLLLCLGAKAETITVTIDKASGTFYKNGTTPNETWNNKWVSTRTNPQLTFTASANNMTTTGQTGLSFYSGTAQSSTYTLSVSGAFHITGYTITGTAAASNQTLTPAGGTPTVFEAGVEQTMSVEVDAMSASFRHEGANKGITGTITVTIEPAVSSMPDATHRYKITNSKGRGSLYFDPTNSALWVWSTGKSDSQTAAANYEWAFVPTGNDAEYYVYNIGRQRYIEPVDGGTFHDSQGGKTWSFTPEKVAITLTDLGDGTFSIKRSSDNTYLSVSNSYTGPAISYYAAGDGGVPFTFESKGDFDPSTIPATVEGLTANDISAIQAYQTTGRGNLTPLLRIDIPGYTKPATLKALTATLKGETKDLVTTVGLYATAGEEFFAETPTKLGEQTVINGETVEITLDHTLATGMNRFWLTATVKADATVGKTIDAQATTLSYAYDDTETTLDISEACDPTGEAKIFKTQSFPFVPTSYNCRFYRIPGMIVADDGSIVAASDKRYNSNADLNNHKIDVAVRRSIDGGLTWSEPQLIAVGDGYSEAAFGYGDAALAKAPNGDLIAVMAAGKNLYWDGITHIGLTISKDNGLTWSPLREMTTSNFTDEIGNVQDQFAEFSNFISSGRGITTREGEVMFLGNVLYNNDHRTVHNHIFRSGDNGESWTLSKESVYGGGDEAKLVQRSDGSILASIRQNGARGFNTGDKSGRIWAGQYRSGSLSGNACNADIIAYNDRLMLHTILVNTNSREDLRLYASIDNGETWHEVYQIQPGYAAYSSMEKLPNGDLAIIFEDASYGNNGYITSYVTLPKDIVEAFADNAWGDEPTSYSQRVKDEMGAWFETEQQVYYSLTDEARKQLLPQYNQYIQSCTADEYFTFLEAVREALKSGVKVPETGYYRIRSTRARGLYTYIGYGQEPQNGKTGLITVPAETGKENFSTVIKLTRLANDRYMLSLQGLNVQGKPAANELFQGAETNGQEFTINPVDGKPGVVGITTGDGGGYLNETNWRTDGYNGVTCWNISDPASQWMIEDADYVNVPLTAIDGKSYTTVCVPFPFKAEYARPAAVTSNAGESLADYMMLPGVMPTGTPLMLVSEDCYRSARLNVINEEPAPITASNDLLGTFLPFMPSEPPYLLGENNEKPGFWLITTDEQLPANSAYLPGSPAAANGMGFILNDVTSVSDTLRAADNASLRVYDLQGRRLQTPSKGVNIINGKKVVR